MSVEIYVWWIIIGILLMIGEMMTAGFFLMFLALGCFVAALPAALDMTLVVQLITCAVVAIIGIFVLRKPIQARLLKKISIQADIGKEIQISQSIAPHQQARITYQGTSWQATNLDSEILEQGHRVRIVGIDGNTLLLRKSH